MKLRWSIVWKSADEWLVVDNYTLGTDLEVPMVACVCPCRETAEMVLNALNGVEALNAAQVHLRNGD